MQNQANSVRSVSDAGSSNSDGSYEDTHASHQSHSPRVSCWCCPSHLHSEKTVVIDVSTHSMSMYGPGQASPVTAPATPSSRTGTFGYRQAHIAAHIAAEEKTHRGVRSLEQIYSQAICLEPLLRTKVQDWARVSGAMFPRKSGGFVKWAEVEGGSGAEEVRWAELKKEERAMEKVLRCYGDDTSQLVDVCRHMLVFETLAGVTECLRAMAADGEVVVVRVKNRMAMEYASGASAGFRNVSVNLRLVSEPACLLGVERHIAEIQLLLRAFADVAKTDGHKRYVAFRNIRGEWLSGPVQVDLESRRYNVPATL